jgi:hypothetical protein
MLIRHRGAVRHPKFSEAVERLSKKVQNAHQIIDGAIWEIQRDPTAIGVHIREIDVWQARLVIPPILLLYCFNRRYVTMLAIIPGDDSFSF